MARDGLLLINLGTPQSAKKADVRRYLAEFLSDKRIINLPTLIRYLLVYGLIIPFRTRKSAQAYQLIWTEQGSPLLLHSLNMMNLLQKTVGTQYKVALGMRYGKPSLAQALDSLKDCATITILPLYPQYSSAATGSCLEEVMHIITRQEIIPSLLIIRDFYRHPAYISSQAQIIAEQLKKDSHLLFSYHGIPERQLLKSGCKKICPDHCAAITEKNQGCYKAQCHQTSLLLAQTLQLNPDQYSTAFQSRLGKTPWIKPYTDELLIQLAQQGIKDLTVACPSFVADCLETLEEIGIRAKEQWFKLGGEQFKLIPCLNDQPYWIKSLQEISCPYSNLQQNFNTAVASCQ